MSEMAQCGRCGAPVEVGALFCSKCGVDVTAVGGDDATVAVTTGGSPATSGPPRSTMRQMLREATLGEYEILEELGRGGMATVFRAHDISLDRKVAIKVMAPHLLEGEGMAERFKLEARTAAQLSHPHIIPIYAVKESASTLFFVMKYVEGRALDEIIAKMGPLPIPMVKDILLKVGSGLGYAHRRDVVHRDVKPGNIMIDDEGTPIVTDFGIAKVAETKGLTMTGTTIGTPSYMSPEQCEAKEVTGASDQYSLGIVAFHMLTGQLPYEGDSAVTVMYKHCHEDLPPLEDFRPDCPPEMLETIKRMVSKDPADRWPSLEAAMQKLAQDGSSQPQLDPIRSHLMKAAQEGDLELLAQLSTPGGPISGVGRTTGTPAAARSGRTGMMIGAAVVVLFAAGALAVTQPWAASGEGGVSSETASASVASGEVGDGSAAPGASPGSGGSGGAEAGAGGAAAGGSDEATTSDDGPSVANGGGSADDVADASGGGSTTPPPPASSSPPPSSSADPPPLRVSSVRVAGIPGGVQPGDVLQLSATAVDQSGSGIPASTVQNCEGRGWSQCGFLWASSNPSVATVDSDGRVTALSAGSAEISVEAGGTVGRQMLTVNRAAVTTVAVSPTNVTVQEGEPVRLSARALDRGGQALSDRSVQWRSSDPSVLRISGGEGTAGRPGTAVVTATVEGVSASATVIVEAEAVDARTAASELIQAYARALERGDVGAVRRVFPGLSREEQQAVERLGELQDLAVELSIDSFQDFGTTASAQLSGSYAFEDRSAGAQRLDVSFAADFEQGPAGRWLITGMRQIR